MNLKILDELRNDDGVLTDVTEALGQITTAAQIRQAQRDALIDDLVVRLTSVEEKVAAWADPEDKVWIPVQDAWIWTTEGGSVRVQDGNRLVVAVPEMDIELELVLEPGFSICIKR